MKVGTRSLLFGVHQFLLHPVFVLAGWRRIYGRLPHDPRIWAACVVHDWGYWGSPNMDGILGEQHPRLGAAIMGALFGPDWYRFTLLHSRFFAAALNLEPSALCYADKAAILVTPRWLYLLQARLSGELEEYRRVSSQPGSKYAAETQAGQSDVEWHANMCRAVRRFLAVSPAVSL